MEDLMRENVEERSLAGEGKYKDALTETDVFSNEESQNKESQNKESQNKESQNKESLTIEETFEELDNLLDMLEQSDNSLEESFRYFARGMKLVRQCSSQIDKVEKQIFILSEEEGQ